MCGALLSAVGIPDITGSPSQKKKHFSGRRQTSVFGAREGDNSIHNKDKTNKTKIPIIHIIQRGKTPPRVSVVEFFHSLFRGAVAPSNQSNNKILTIN